MSTKATYHESIHTLPIGRFMRVMQKGDLQALAIEGKPSGEELKKAWDRVLNEQIEEFGIPKQYRQYLQLLSKACIHRANAYLKGQKHEKAYAKIAEAEAELIGNDGQAVSFSKQIAAISKKMGFRVDPNTTTVFEFYSYLNGQ